MTDLQDPAFYLRNRDGNPTASEVVNPETNRRERAFFLWADMPRLRQYIDQSGMDQRAFNLMSFQTVEDVERFVEQHRDFYQWVFINPRLGVGSGMEPFGELVNMARSLAVEE